MHVLLSSEFLPVRNLFLANEDSDHFIFKAFYTLELKRTLNFYVQRTQFIFLEEVMQLPCMPFKIDFYIREKTCKNKKEISLPAN